MDNYDSDNSEGEMYQSNENEPFVFTTEIYSNTDLNLMRYLKLISEKADDYLNVKQMANKTEIDFLKEDLDDGEITEKDFYEKQQELDNEYLILENLYKFIEISELLYNDEFFYKASSLNQPTYQNTIKDALDLYNQYIFPNKEYIQTLKFNMVNNEFYIQSLLYLFNNFEDYIQKYNQYIQGIQTRSFPTTGMSRSVFPTSSFSSSMPMSNMPSSSSQGEFRTIIGPGVSFPSGQSSSTKRSRTSDLGSSSTTTSRRTKRQFE